MRGGLLQGLLRCCQVALTQVANGLVECSGVGPCSVGLLRICRRRGIGRLLFQLLHDGLQVGLQLLQLAGQLFGITTGIASLFLDACGHALLSLCQLFELFGECGSLVQLSFAGGLQQFLLFFQQVLQLLIKLLLFALQSLLFSGQLFLKIFR